MKILFLSHRLPFPPDKGDKIRAYHLIRCLTKHGHEVDVAALADDPADLDPKRHEMLKKVCRNLAVVGRSRLRGKLAAFTAVPRGVAASLPCFYSRELQNVCDEWMKAEGYDAVFAHSAPMAQYAAKAPAGTVRVVDYCDVDSEKWKQYAATSKFPASFIYRREYQTLRKYECELAKTWDAVTIISHPEAALFRSFCPQGKVGVIPNGVDSDFFSPGRALRDPATVLFMGAMDYRPNVEGVLWFAEHVWPKVRQQVPHAKFVIVGPRPTEAVKKLDDMSHGGAGQGILVTGYVNDIRDVLGAATVSVAPLHIARGVQNKVLEAMAAGLPVVATHAAFEGIFATAGRDLLVSDEAGEFAAKVVQLLGNPAMRAKLGASGRAAVVASHSWDAFTERLEGLLGQPAVAPSAEIVAFNPAPASMYMESTAQEQA